MRELRWGESCRFEDQDVFESICEMVLATNNVADAEVCIVGARREMIGRHAVGTKQGEVFDISGCLYLFAINSVGKVDRQFAFGKSDSRGRLSPHRIRIASSRHAKAQGKRLSGGGASIAFYAGKLAHSGVEEPRALPTGSFAVTGVGRGEIAVREAFLEDDISHASV